MSIFHRESDRERWQEIMSRVLVERGFHLLEMLPNGDMIIRQIDSRAQLVLQRDNTLISRSPPPKEPVANKAKKSR